MQLSASVLSLNNNFSVIWSVNDISIASIDSNDLLKNEGVFKITTSILYFTNVKSVKTIKIINYTSVNILKNNKIYIILNLANKSISELLGKIIIENINGQIIYENSFKPDEIYDRY